MAFGLVDQGLVKGLVHVCDHGLEQPLVVIFGAFLNGHDFGGHGHGAIFDADGARTAFRKGVAVLAFATLKAHDARISKVGGEFEAAPLPQNEVFGATAIP